MKQGERFVVGVVGVHFAGPKRLLSCLRSVSIIVVSVLFKKDPKFSDIIMIIR